MLDYNWQDIPTFPIPINRIEKWLVAVCSDEGCELSDLSIVFMSDDGLLEINKQFLSHDYYTDIITFDYSENGMVSGDLFVSVDRVKENASGLSIEWLEELNRVLVHGVLHLIGYGDKGDEEEKIMRSKEDFYLNKLKGFT